VLEKAHFWVNVSVHPSHVHPLPESSLSQCHPSLLHVDGVDGPEGEGGVGKVVNHLVHLVGRDQVVAGG